MKFQKTVIVTAMSVVIGITSFNAQAATFQNGDVLTIDAGRVTTDFYGSTFVSTGSFFALDVNLDHSVQHSERTPLAMGTTGIVIGQTSTAGASHGGAPLSGDTNEITAPWLLNTATGSDQLTVAATGDTTNGLDMSGWTVNWNGGSINLGAGGAWNVLNCADSSMGCAGATFVDNTADISWSGTYGDTYTLFYTAAVPSGGQTLPYFLKLTGTVEQGIVPSVPVPAAVWLFGSGLLGLVGVARRKKFA